ncbi:hypothetical protein [Actinomyces naeslundii]|jgi:hypothetical protein|uniref:hypothetical protein n=1 Tax=Actinomyces naeslundii TaxID=1655 RepID=UPI003C6EC622
METLSSYNQDQNKTQERDAATVQLDEMVSREYGIPIETARELNDELIVDAIAVAVQMGIPRRQAPSDEQLGL